MARKSRKSAKAKRPASAWVKHCLAFAKKNNMNYRDALSNPKCKAEYRAAKKSPSRKASSKKTKRKSKKSRR